MYAVASLEEGIKKSDANIILFEEAIKKERATQEDYRNTVREADRMREKRGEEKEVVTSGISLEALEAGIKKCDDNIVIFEEAIKKERATQEEYRQMIKDAERMAEKREVVENGVKIEAE